jgi:hypothetical protein
MGVPGVETCLEAKHEKAEGAFAVCALRHLIIGDGRRENKFVLVLRYLRRGWPRLLGLAGDLRRL